MQEATAFDEELGDADRDWIAQFADLVVRCFALALARVRDGQDVDDAFVAFEREEAGCGVDVHSIPRLAVPRRLLRDVVVLLPCH